MGNDDGDKNLGFGFSGIRDAYFVWLYDGCGGAEAASRSSPSHALEGTHLDSDDEDGALMVEACELLGQTRDFVEAKLASTNQMYEPGKTSPNAADDADGAEEKPVLEPLMWGVQAP